ncbi:hypothetical protein [Tahibacter soli]|uniref:Uncharacterized protein n=1 Tax=Tahibacter soli TaxID=2983605 RepID=A0A9X3YQJ9_9GAMM|nr:hypothetical protein [Tahibacter soli]MDC8015128.1 hypothetical protein [Tahibacter soli]
MKTYRDQLARLRKDLFDKQDGKKTGLLRDSHVEAFLLLADEFESLLREFDEKDVRLKQLRLEAASNSNPNHDCMTGATKWIDGPYSSIRAPFYSFSKEAAHTLEVHRHRPKTSSEDKSRAESQGGARYELGIEVDSLGKFIDRTSKGIDWHRCYSNIRDLQLSLNLYISLDGLERELRRF